MNKRRTKNRSREKKIIEEKVYHSRPERPTKKLNLYSSSKRDRNIIEEEAIDLGDRSKEFLAQKELKLNRIKKRTIEKKEEEEFKECTFKPRINKRSKHKKRGIEDLFQWRDESRTKQSAKKCQEIKKEATFKPHIDEKSKEIFEHNIDKSKERKKVESRLLIKAKNKEKKLNKLRNEKLVGYFQPDMKSTENIMRHKFKNTKSRYLCKKKKPDVLESLRVRTVSPMVKKRRRRRSKRVEKETNKDNSLSYQSRRKELKTEKNKRSVSSRRKKLEFREKESESNSEEEDEDFGFDLPKKRKSSRKSKYNSASRKKTNGGINSKSIPRNYFSNLNDYSNRSRSNENDENSHWRPQKKDIKVEKLIKKSESEERIEKAKNALKELNEMLGVEFGVLAECDQNKNKADENLKEKSEFNVKIKHTSVKNFAGLKNAIGKGRSKSKKSRRERSENHRENGNFDNFKGLKDKVNMLFNRDKIR